MRRVTDIWDWQSKNRRPSWDELAMMIAEIVATRSTCDRGPEQRFRDHKGVGAVIVSPDHRQIACGYNGSPPDLPHCDDNPLHNCPYCMRRGTIIPDGISETYSCTACGKVLIEKTVLTCGDHLMVDGHCVRTIHAEENAILNATFELKGCSVYSTSAPCYDCCKRIISVGISKVVYQHIYESRYEATDLGIELLKKYGIKVKHMEDL